MIRRITFLFHIICRQIKWFGIVISSYGKIHSCRVFSYEMQFPAYKAGLDLKEEHIYKQLAMDGVREKAATAVMKEFIEPGDVLLEAGANIGYYVLLEASILDGNGKIYAVEPEPENIKLLRKNISLNDLDDFVSSYHMGFSDKKGHLPLYISNKSNLHSFIKPEGADFKTKNIEMTTIDEFIANKDKNINFIRMDIEGYECKVVHGMKKFLSKKGPAKLFIELHPHLVDESATRGLLKTLKKYGFELHAVISHDNALRESLGQVKIETLTIDQLLKDERISTKPISFEAFFSKA